MRDIAIELSINLMDQKMKMLVMLEGLELLRKS